MSMLRHPASAHRRCCLVLAWLGLFLGLFLGLWLASMSPAWAHASLTGTEPADGAMIEAAPERFRLSFSEPVSPLSLRLIRPDGESVDIRRYTLRDRTLEIEPPGDLTRGTHVLTWRVVSADGHPVGGSVVFSIGEASAAPPSVAEPADGRVAGGLWLTRLAIYIGLFIGIGGAFGLAWLWPVSRHGAGIIGAAIGIGLAGAGLAPGVQGLDALGVGLSRFFDAAIWTAGLGTSFGWTVAAMLVACALAAISLLCGSERLSRLLATLALLAGALAMAMSGHASTADPQWLTRPAVALHAAAIAVWAGALIPLGLSLRANAPDAGAALRRFSSLIPVALLVLVAAGVALAWVQVETPAALVETAYGRLLLIKLGLVTLLLALAALNRWRLTRSAIACDGTARRRLVRIVAVETLIVIAILGVASGWRFTPPPRSLAIAAAQPATMHIHAAKVMADVTVTPGRAGPVIVSAALMTGSFGPLDAKEVVFVFSNPKAGIEAFRGKADRQADGRWRATGVILPLSGPWSLQIEILVTDFDLERIEGEIDIRR